MLGLKPQASYEPFTSSLLDGLPLSLGLLQNPAGSLPVPDIPSPAGGMRRSLLARSALPLLGLQSPVLPIRLFGLVSSVFEPYMP